MFVVKVLMLTTNEENAKGTYLSVTPPSETDDRIMSTLCNKDINPSSAMTTLFKKREVISKLRSAKKQLIFWLPIHT